MDAEVKEAYQRGIKDGEVHSLTDSVDRAHDRLDKHDVRMSALEKVMYMGMGVIFLINAMPFLADMVKR
jgi:hypothetical protein